jgi:mannose-1-phosphate guanylyltransferase/mannose-6-phosphate isomerase
LNRPHDSPEFNSQIMKIQPVVLSGGSGTRLWPLSREQFPKQLLPLCGEHTMLQATVLRLDGDAGEDPLNAAAPIVVGNEEYRFIVGEQLRAVSKTADSLILEPVGRNTAPALTLAALQAMHDGGDPILVVMPADHVIRDGRAFRDAIRTAAALAVQGVLVTFGIAPTTPETGYGYIRRGMPMTGLSHGCVHVLERFVEKSDVPTV